MPTNLPDPRKRKTQASEEPFVYLMITVIVAGMFIACVIVGWSIRLSTFPPPSQEPVALIDRDVVPPDRGPTR
jgi:hypothetical protein